MSVKKDPSGRRSVQVEVEVPGTPEQVWQAIGTGPGVSSWFVPTTFSDDNTRVVSTFGPGMDGVATITRWDPPRGFEAESANRPGGPTMATEWTVEARAGGTCIVRVVHSLFATTDDWDDQLEGTESGWPVFFRLLKLYLEHFAGRQPANMQVMGFSQRSAGDTWTAAMRALGLEDASAADERVVPVGTPEPAAIVEAIGGEKHFLIMRTLEPLPGLLCLSAHTMGGQVCIFVSGYLFGDDAAATVGRVQQAWQAWLDALLAPVANASGV